jgi:hypothetical protein
LATRSEQQCRDGLVPDVVADGSDGKSGTLADVLLARVIRDSMTVHRIAQLRRVDSDRVTRRR